ncbi:exopolyphosphatase [Ammoniphilus oxalaticus]|uniref:Exopolyphosphatase n=1 Tax=Ammoniphilus oxalaticus TaxID=66863 RepID=A0A419SJX3_9BACL|nr:DHH family phosphoesterase [Ammoniphilus oxalaticus]RKD24272.1 exopolyphosphatase [Ammoniphilus oxalaticus]
MMEYSDQLAAASRFLNENDHFLVVNHVNPDGDATGSILAMGYLLRLLGKQFTLANEGATPAKFFAATPSSLTVQNVSESPLQQKYKYVITLDCGDLARVGAVEQYFADDVQILNIDHHATNDHFGAVNVVRPLACATAEILLDLSAHNQFPMSVELASFLYMGILTDTGGFRYANTTADVMEKVAELLRIGVDPGAIADRCLETIRRSHLDLLQLVLPTLSLHRQDQIAFLSISLQAREQSQAVDEDMEQIVNYARNIEGVEVGVLFKQMDQQTVKISFRSRQDVDVSLIAKQLGGGGHARAAGCTAQGSLEEVQRLALQKIENLWGEK